MHSVGLHNKGVHKPHMMPEEVEREFMDAFGVVIQSGYFLE